MLSEKPEYKIARIMLSPQKHTHRHTHDKETRGVYAKMLTMVIPEWVK